MAARISRCRTHCPADNLCRLGLPREFGRSRRGFTGISALSMTATTAEHLSRLAGAPAPEARAIAASAAAAHTPAQRAPVVAC